MTLITRRGLLTGLIAAPLVVASSRLMPLRGEVLKLDDLRLRHFTLSWWEKISVDEAQRIWPSRWRQNATRFTAYSVPRSSMEVNPAPGTLAVAGVQLDRHGWVMDDGHESPVDWREDNVPDPTWHEGAPVIHRWHGPVRGSDMEIELSAQEEAALLGHRPGPQQWW